jgi:hypothetical protein
MTKQEQFLWIAQTTVIANAIDSSPQPDRAEQYGAELFATDAFIAMEEAVHASGFIPDNLSAAQAANEFCTFMLKNMRDAEENATGKALAVPLWFIRHGDDPTRSAITP